VSEGWGRRSWGVQKDGETFQKGPGEHAVTERRGEKGIPEASSKEALKTLKAAWAKKDVQKSISGSRLRSSVKQRRKTTLSRASQGTDRAK